MRDTRSVYSTDQGRLCPECGAAQTVCRCKSPGRVLPKGDGVVRIGRETKGRNGKGVTLITGLPLDEEGLKDKARALKQFCGTGGTLKDGVIEIQGDHRDKLLARLQQEGYKVKLAGG